MANVSGAVLAQFLQPARQPNLTFQVSQVLEYILMLCEGQLESEWSNEVLKQSEQSMFNLHS